MITIRELSELTHIKINTIHYWMKNDEYFRRSFFWKEEKITSKAKNRKYVSKIYMCDEGDICRIIDYIRSQKVINRNKAQWTDTALECYQRKMNCYGCSMHRYCAKFEHPPMKDVVLDNIRKYGEPR